MVRSYDKTKKATQEKLQGEACIQYAAAVNLPSHLLLPTTHFSSPHGGSTAADSSTRAPRYFGLMPEELGGESFTNVYAIPLDYYDYIPFPSLPRPADPA